MLLNFIIIQNFLKFKLQFPKLSSSTTVVEINYYKKKCFTVISEDLYNTCRKFRFVFTGGVNYTLRYIKIEQSVLIVRTFYNITVVTVLLIT